MSQFLPPISDSSVLNWSAPVWSKVNGLAPGDADYTYTTPSDPQGALFRVALQPGSYPKNRDSGHVLRFRHRQTGSGVEMSVLLQQGTTTIATRTVTPPASFETVSIELTPAEIEQITDYSQLFVQMIAGDPVVPCCPSPVPRTLRARLSNVSGCASLANLEFQLNYDGTASWIGSSNSLCGAKMNLYLQCIGNDANGFSCFGDWGAASGPIENLCMGPFPLTLISGTCGPDLLFRLPSGQMIQDTCGCCGGNSVSFDVTIDAVP